MKLDFIIEIDFVNIARIIVVDRLNLAVENLLMDIFGLHSFFLIRMTIVNTLSWAQILFLFIVNYIYCIVVKDFGASIL